MPSEERKANSVFDGLKEVWKNKLIGLFVRVMATMSYDAEMWPLTIVQMKKLEALQHEFQ